MIVADTNLIAYLFLTGEHTATAEEVFGRDPEWAVPILWRSEFRSVLAHYLRRGQLGYDDALRIYEAAEMVVEGREFTPAAPRILELIGESTCSAYDCEFVALAEDLGVRLVTSDRQLLAAFPSVARSPAEFLAS